MREGFSLRIVLISLVFTLLYAEDSFITPFEYAKMLYESPRGVGCNLCHGSKGRGKTIARYKKRKELKELKAPDITSVDFKTFYKKLNSRKKRSAMPTYFLTRDEIKALYFYIKKVNE